jgi:hypothetical protein
MYEILLYLIEYFICYHTVAICVIGTSWAHVWRLRFHFLKLGYDTLSRTSYLFYSYFILSFNACIVTITWSVLFIIIALWVIYPTR